jgi:hypothetical protein
MHSLKDAQLTQSVALAAAGASVSTTPLDLSQTPPNAHRFEVELALPALPGLADGKTVSVTLEDSEDGASFAAIPELSALVITGGGGTGSAAATRRVRLPSSARRHLRATAATQAAAGNLTAQKLTLALVF